MTWIGLIMMIIAFSVSWYKFSKIFEIRSYIASKNDISHYYSNGYDLKISSPLGLNYLHEKLKALISSNEFSTDIESHKENASPHEYVSAYVTYKVFGNTIRELEANPEFVVRMIIGCFYDDKSVLSYYDKFRNKIFICLWNKENLQKII